MRRTPAPHALAVLSVLGAAACWGALGVSYELLLDRYPISRLTILAIRATVAGGVLALVILGRPALRHTMHALAARETMGAVVALGLVSTAGFYVALSYAFQEAGVAVGTVLLYLAPSFVALGAWLFLGQRVSPVQRVALAGALVGVVGVSGALEDAAGASAAGILLGIASAVGYASYSVIGAVALRRLPAIVVVSTSLLAGAVVLWVVRIALEGTSLPGWHALAVVALVNGVGTTLVPMMLYTRGMLALGPTRASLLAIAEPVVAVVLAWLVLDERLSVLQLAGAAAIVLSLIAAASGREQLREG